MQLVDRLNEVIAERHLLKHPFYRAWSQGELSIKHLQQYAAQYYQQVQSFPRFISRVHTYCPEIDARKILLENLVDEEIHGTDHPALWIQFAEGMGVPHDSVVNEVTIVETQSMVDTYYELAERDWRDGLCALYAYECQVPDVSASKIAGLKKYYGIDNAYTLEFFTAHQEYDVGHANVVAALIEKYADVDHAIQATIEARDVLWNFLNGMCRIGNIVCEQ